MATLNEETAANLRQAMDAAVSSGALPGVVFASVNKEGKNLFSHASGTRGADSKEPMTLDTVFWIASCTKMINAIAVTQLVEAGKIGLDDADALEKLCPELASVKILKDFTPDGKPVLEEKKNRITLRMLQTHTAGFGYSFFHPFIKNYADPLHFEEFSGYPRDVLGQPILFEPGTSWEYGVGIDWAGTVVERISGLKLNDYFQKHIFEPLGITEITMLPRKDMVERLARMHQREPDGKLRARDHLQRRPLVAAAGWSSQEDVDAMVHSAGAGCFAKPTEYVKIIAALLNDGTSPTNGGSILTKGGVDLLLENQVAHFPDFARSGVPAAKPDMTNAMPEIYPQEGNPPQGWSLAGFLNIQKCPTGRSAGSTWWAGLANLFWFLDREKGVGGMVATQILPFGDAEVLGLWANLEIGIYGAI